MTATAPQKEDGRAPVLLPGDGPFRVGEWLVDVSANEIRCGSVSERLQPRVMDLLVFLARNAPRPVSRDELIDAVWEGTAVSDDAVTNAIVKLRRALGDDKKESRYIDTISKSGYRFIAPVSQTAPGLGSGGAGQAVASLPLPGGRRQLNAILLGVVAVLGLTVLGLAYVVLTSQPEMRVPKITQATFLPGGETMPAPAPDGEKIAFVWSADQAQGGQDTHIYLLDQTTGELMQLTTSPYRDTSPVFSPDGGSVAFIRFDGLDCGIFRVSAAGGEPEALQSCGAAPMYEFTALDWSPDGRWLAYMGSGSENWLFHIGLYEFETGETRRLTFPTGDNFGDLNPVFSPDSQYVAFMRFFASGTKDVFMVETATGSTTQLTEDQSRIHGLTWSADGSAVLYSAGNETSAELWQVDVATKTTSPVAAIPTGLLHIRTGPRGELYGGLRRVSGVEAQVISLDSDSDEGSRRQVLDPQSKDVTWPKFSPDGKQIAYISRRAELYELWIADLDGLEPRRLLTFDTDSLLNSFQWSRDGSLIALSTGDAAMSRIHLVELATGEMKTLLSSQFSSSMPVMIDDNRAVVYGSRRDGAWQLRRLSLLDGVDRLLVRGGGMNTQQSPDGKWIYYYRYDDPGGIWRTDLAGRETRLVLSEPNRIQSWFNWEGWHVAEDGIYFATPSETGTELHFFDFATQATERLFVLDNIKISAFSITPDRRWMAYAPRPRIDSDIVRIELPPTPNPVPPGDF